MLARRFLYVYGASYQLCLEQRTRKHLPGLSRHASPFLNVLEPVVKILRLFNSTFLVEKFSRALLFNLLKAVLISS